MTLHIQSDTDTKPLPAQAQLSPSERYRAYSIELFSEAVKQMARLIRQPDAPRGQLIVTLENLVSSLREQPFRPVTEYERQVRERAIELLDVADLSLNSADTNEGRAKLFQLVYQLRNPNGAKL